VGVLLAVAALNFIKKNPNTASVIRCHMSIVSVLSGFPKKLEVAVVFFLSSRSSH
jgi:hypothetical protein